MNALKQVAIDGPSCTGKSTAAKKLADRLGYGYLSAGEFYRSYVARLIQLGEKRREACVELLRSMTIEVDPANFHIIVDGNDFFGQLREGKVTLCTAEMCRYEPFLRDGMEKIIPALGERVVMDGRNIGSEIMPHAAVKIYLDADLDVRAKRRLGESGEGDISQVREALELNDKEEMSRSVGRLQKSSDAFVLDTSSMTPDEVVDAMYEKCCFALAY